MVEARPRDILARKAALRRQLRAARAAIPPEDRARMARAVEERLFALPALQGARTVLVFDAFGSEVPTQGIIDRLRREGRRVLLPFLEGGEMLAAEARPDDPLVPTSYGPREPSDRTPVDPAEVDVVVVPGLAFDRQGHRIGYGAGYYDRYLARLPARALRVGIGFHLQLVDALPHHADDQPVDVVVTDRETVECRRPRG
jgi:5-formyltetrahydrofolate cyclo-ligase